MARPAATAERLDERPSRMVRRERWALVALAVSGAAFVPQALNRFVFVKLAVAAGGLVLASTVAARSRLPRSAVALLGAAAILLLGGAIAGGTPYAQILGRAPRYEGLFTLAVYFGACVAGARLLGARRARGSTAWFLRSLAVVAVAIGLEAAVEAAGLRPLATSVARPGGLLGNASDLGAWAVLALGPLTAAGLRTREPRLLVGAIAAAATLVISGSRGALVGALTVALVLLVLSPSRQRAGLLAGLAAIAIAVVILPATRARVFGASPLAGQTVSGRAQLWDETARLIAADPLLGVGPSGYVDAIPGYHTPQYELTVGPDPPPDSPHNWVLQSAVAGGLPLALIGLVLAGLTLRRGHRATREQSTGGEAAALQGMLAGLAGYAVALLSHFTSPGTTPLAATIAGALLAGPAADHHQARRSLGRTTLALAESSARARSAGRVVVVALLGLLVTLLAAASLAEIPLRAAIDQAPHGDARITDHDLRLAEAFRPWDTAIPATAAHVYATLAAVGVSSAKLAGTRWSDRELVELPHSIQALQDAATLAAAQGQLARADLLVTRAVGTDRNNPDLLVEAGELGLALHRPQAAISALRRAVALAPHPETAWLALAAAYRFTRDRADAALAEAHAQRFRSLSDSAP